ncbi:PREDICTED: uncharacterized protein LOC109588858 [Amphimedon queenslandica]|uniref:Uncharacterized protein n=1 Tax=Amphimedon queenslandica TaxID=400682 RepID=A0AAN0JUI3_AMPQE|nr:PREDICTED: uncharacterized protein LOC109588858 [Amphimedon queenslandica]|eukprot:XP_019860523.1 PREDICTED: uncharacterized protein LOC109588858 [Amphimedon queenslandica]
MIYRDGKTQLQFKDNSPNVIKPSEEAINACSQVLTATFKCLQSITQTLRGVKYSVAIPCRKKSHSDYHYLYRSHKSNLCNLCSAQVIQNKFRFCWSLAAKKCKISEEDDMSKFINVTQEKPRPTEVSATPDSVPVYGAKIIELENQDVKEKEIYFGQLLNMLFSNAY